MPFPWVIRIGSKTSDATRTSVTPSVGLEVIPEHDSAELFEVTESFVDGVR